MKPITANGAVRPAVCLLATVGLFFLSATARGQSTTRIDITDPPAALAAMLGGDGKIDIDDNGDDTAEFNTVIDYVTTETQQAILFIPPPKSSGNVNGGLRISSEVVIDDIDGLRIEGAGHARSDTTGSNKNAYSKIVWDGNSTGSAVHFQDVDGLVVQGISFESRDAALDILVKHTNPTGGSGSLNLKFEDCGFHNAQTLFYNGASDLSLGAANILFDNCVFDGEHTNSSAARYAFYNVSNQGLLFTFQHCYWFDVGTALYFHQGGRSQVYGGGSHNVAEFLHVENGGQNVSGHTVRDLFIDGGGTKRMLWLATSGTIGGKTYGPFVFENITMTNNYPAGGASFVEISSWSGTTLILGGLVDLRPGDRVKFYDENDHDTPLAETTVVTRNAFDDGGSGTAEYTVSDTCCDLVGLPTDLTTVDAAAGDAFFLLHGGENVTVRNCFFEDETIQGQRLVRMKTSTFDTGRVPVIVFDQCMGFKDLSAAGDLFTKYVEQIDTPSYYRFRDCMEYRGNIDVFSTTNIP